MYQINALDRNVIEASKETTAGGLLTEALWSSSHVRKDHFEITTRRDGSLVLSREMAMALEREIEGLRFGLELCVEVLDRFRDYGTAAWDFERNLCVALGYGRQVLAQSAGYDVRHNDRRFFPRDTQPRKRARAAKKPAPKALTSAAPKTD